MRRSATAVTPDWHPLIELGEALFGPTYWRAGLLDALGVNERTFRRWLNGTADIPPGAITDAQRLLAERRHLLAERGDRIDRLLASLRRPI